VGEPKVVKKEVKQFFEERFNASATMRLNLDGVPFKKIGEDDN